MENELNAKLAAALKRAMLLLDSSPLSAGLWDKNLKVFHCNAASVRLFRLNSKQDFIDRFHELSPEYQPDGALSRDKESALVHRAFEEGHCVFEWTHQLLDETPIPSEVTLVRVEYDGDYMVAGYVRDLREQKRILDRLERRDELLDMANRVANILLESEPEAFETTMRHCLEMISRAVNADRTSVWFNSVKDGRLHCVQIHEWPTSADALTHKDMTSEISYDDIVPGWKETLSRGHCINSFVRDMSPAEQVYLSRQGILSLCVAPIFVRGSFWGFMSFDNCREARLFDEIEEDILRSCSMMLANALLQHEMIQSIRAATEAKSNFLANMSHEIRTPMNAIMGTAEIHLYDENLAPHFREALETIYSASDMLLNIINDILDLSKIESGNLELAIDKYDSASLINDTTMLSIMRTDSRPIDFELSVDEKLPATLFGDALRIRQILNNLLSNAFKYTEKGRVKLTISCEAGKEPDNVTLVCVVSDTGVGMTEEQLARLFDRYARFNMEIHRSIQGAGLGMSIVKSLLHLMNGAISVQSELHRGSAVSVAIPQKRADADVLGKELAASLQNFTIAGTQYIRRARVACEPMPYGSVLIVDDVESNIYVAKGLMSPYGLSVDTAMSGFEAIDKIRAGKVYDIIFMDHMMPKMDGIEAVGILRDLGYAHPIVALTANAVVGQSDIFLSRGFDDFISKPIDLRHLNAILHKLVRDRHPPEVVAAARRQKNGAHEPGAGARPPASVDPKLATIFLRDAFKSLAVLEAFREKRSAYSDEDMRAYVVCIHGMKSALAHLGERELSARALKLEQAGRAGDAAVIAAETPTFVDALQELIEKIRPQEEGKGSGATMDEEQAHVYEKLLVLKAACAAYNKKAAKEALAGLEQKAPPGLSKELLETIAGHLLHSKFKVIAQLVDEFLGGTVQRLE